MSVAELIGSWVVLGTVFGVYQYKWMKQRQSQGQHVTSPIGQFVFVVKCAPIALVIAVFTAWSIALAIWDILLRL
jgi:hypothetical protein